MPRLEVAPIEPPIGHEKRYPVLKQPTARKTSHPLPSSFYMVKPPTFKKQVVLALVLESGDSSDFKVRGWSRLQG